MKEVLTAGFKRLLKEDPDRSLACGPDLLLIDGGAGQVSAKSHRSMARIRGRGIFRWVGCPPRAWTATRASGIPTVWDNGPWRCGTRCRCCISFNGLRDEWPTGSPTAHTAAETRESRGATPLEMCLVPGASGASGPCLGTFRVCQAVGRANLRELERLSMAFSGLANEFMRFFP